MTVPAPAPTGGARQIFGRQPVIYIGVIQAVLLLLVSFHALKAIGLNGPDDVMLAAGVLNAAAAVYLAFGTTETLLAPLIELFKVFLSFAAIYGMNLTGEQSGLAVATITAVFAMLHQPKTSPQATLGVTAPVLLAPENAEGVYQVTNIADAPAAVDGQS